MIGTSQISGAPALTRPVMRWHGGKWKLAPWIIAHFPPHRIYVEPFGGAASVLLRKPRSYAEIYNDLDRGVVNLFRVLRDDILSRQLIDALRMTPFARDEFEAAYLDGGGPVERARKLIILGFMGFGSNGHNKNIKTGFRANSNRSGTTPAHDWGNYPDCMGAIIERLRGVVIENRDAQDVMSQHDSPETLHYADPPYMWNTRSSKMKRGRAYNHEMCDADHARLLDFLQTLKGMVIMSGYASAEYDGALNGWARVEKKSRADGARERTEVLWINPAAQARLPQQVML